MKNVMIFSLSLLIILSISSCEMGDISIPSGSKVKDDIDLVAGILKIGDEVFVDGGISMTAGKMTLGVGVTVKRGIDITAGKAEIGAGCVIRNIDMTAGKLSIDKGSVIEKEIDFTAGLVELTGVTVEKGIYLRSGKMVIGSGCVINEGIFIKGNNVDDDDETKVYVKKGAVINGVIRAKHKIKLYVDEGATIPDELIGDIKIIGN